MTGFEVIVRPVVFPVIRPGRARALAPEDDPEKGIAEFTGSSGGLVDLTFSETHSWSKSKPVEVERTVAVERVYQKEKDAPGGQGLNGPLPKGVNPENYVDIERMEKLVVAEANGQWTETFYAKPKPDDPERSNIEIMTPELVIPNPVLPEGFNYTNVYPGA